MCAGRLQSDTTPTEIPANSRLPAQCLAGRCGLCSSWASQHSAAGGGEAETCRVGCPARKLLSRTGVEIVYLETGVSCSLSVCFLDFKRGAGAKRESPVFGSVTGEQSWAGLRVLQLWAVCFPWWTAGWETTLLSTTQGVH